MRALSKYRFLMVYLLIPLPFISLSMGGWYSFLPIIILFGLIPLVDTFLHDTVNPTPAMEKELLGQNYYKYITYLYLPTQLIMIFYGAYLVSTQNLQWNEWLGFTLSIGVLSGGAGINLAHEMMHKNDPVPQLISKALLVSVCYGHFFIEHVKGHHVKVATPEDPATAQLGESFYHFIPKTLIGSYLSAYHLEKRRLSKQELKPWSIHNQFWWIIICPIMFTAVCFILGGFSAALFFLSQSLMAILTLEMVNYIEHYGLERRKLANGYYEKVNEHHSWNANHWITNSILFHLQRHADHHQFGARPYQVLRNKEESPQLPSGYLGMSVIALIPPLWRKIMDSRVALYQKNCN